MRNGGGYHMDFDKRRNEEFNHKSPSELLEETKAIRFETKQTDLTYSHSEIEDEKSNSKYYRETYMDKALIFSDRYITAIKTLGENRYCSKHILEAARTMIEHHHGDKYEDLYFIDTVTNVMKSRTDYRINEQEVLPTKEMKEMARNSSAIISIHNHPTNTLPSYRDILTCYCIGYKYGLVVCHNGNIYQYSTLEDINQTLYNMETEIYERKEMEIATNFYDKKITHLELTNEHNKNVIELSSHLLDAGVIFKEVLWNDNSTRRTDSKKNQN